jgi:hypothetical protein
MTVSMDYQVCLVIRAPEVMIVVFAHPALQEKLATMEIQVDQE